MKAERLGLVIINRIAFLRQARIAGVLGLRPAVREMSDDEVFLRYRGFDGLVWPCSESLPLKIQDGLAPLAELSRLEEYLVTLGARDEYEIIILSTVSAPAKAITIPGWRTVGFDIGYFESEWSHYSIILNEIVYGLEPEMRNLAKGLNEFLLFDSMNCALQVRSIRDSLVVRGADLEQIDRLETIAIAIRG